jgi:hypothetical protein
VPKHFSADEIAYEIRKIMKYDFTETKDLFLEEDSSNNNLYVTFYIFFLSKKSIPKFLQLCHVINEKKVVYMFNHGIEVQFKEKEIWTLMTAEHINDELSDKEIFIRNTTYTNICTLIHLLPEHIRTAHKHHQIQSIIQNNNAVFIRFDSNENANRAMTMLKREGMEVKWSRTYVCICKEEDPVPKKKVCPKKDPMSIRVTGHQMQWSLEEVELKDKGENIINTNNNALINSQIDTKKSTQATSSNSHKRKRILPPDDDGKKNDDVLMLTDDIQFSDVD